MEVIPEIIEEHLDEASFHWLRWERALLSPGHDLADAVEQEERLLAHLDGLVVAGAAAQPLLAEALESGALERVAVAAFALLEGQPQGLEEVLILLRTLPPSLHSALEWALERATPPGVDRRLVLLLDSDEAGLTAAAVRVLTARDAMPPAALEPLLRHELPEVRLAALQAAAGPSGQGLSPMPLRAALESAHPGIRAAAVELGLTWHLRPALATCRELLQVQDAAARQVMPLLALGAAEPEVALLADQAETPGRRADALWALGFSGQPGAAEAALRWMDDEAVAPLAGEAFHAITGLRLEGPYVLPPREEAGDEEEDLDADLVPPPQAALPRPDARAVRDWWSQHASGFQKGTRYLEGRPLDAEALLKGLEHGAMRRRHTLARELAVRSQGRHRVPTRGATSRQAVALAQARTAGASLDMRPWHRLLK